MNVITFAGVPLYALTAVIKLIFMIVISPVGTSDNLVNNEVADLAEIVSEGASFAAVAGLFVLLGLNNSYWKVHGEAPRSSISNTPISALEI